MVDSVTYSRQGKEGHGKDSKTGANGFSYPGLWHFIPVPNSGHCHLKHEKEKCICCGWSWKRFGNIALDYERCLPLPTIEHQHSWKILLFHCCPLRLFLPGTQSTSRRSDPRIQYRELWSVPVKYTQILYKLCIVLNVFNHPLVVWLYVQKVIKKTLLPVDG